MKLSKIYTNNSLNMTTSGIQ